MSNANAVSDFERAEHASNVLAKRVSLVDNEGSQINPATEDTRAKRLAKSGVYVYFGEAQAGTLGSQALWRIQRIDETSDVSIEWADGDANFDNVWDDYLTLNYS